MERVTGLESGTSEGLPSRIGQMLDISPKRLEEVLYFTKYIVIDPGEARN